MILRVKEIMNTITTSNFRIINTDAALRDLADELSGHKLLAVDLEADSMYHFKEKVCLLQLAAGHSVMVVDPLQIEDLSPLGPVFASPDIVKVFHGADYDIRSLYRDFKFEIKNLFDTEIACRFLGARESGLGTVLGELFDVRLDKKFQRKDWSQRPLPEEMITYAAEDVIYLARLREALLSELALKHRTAWVMEECRLLSSVRPADDNHQPLYLKFKGAGRLDGRSLAALENLLQVRKSLARKKDRPLFKILGNPPIMKMALARPRTVNQLIRLKALSKRQIDMYSQAFVDAIQQALEMPRPDLPVYARKRAPVLPAEVPIRIKVLKKWRNQRASAIGLDPGLLCNKTLMCAIAIENPDCRAALENIDEMKTWQKKEFGDEIIRALHPAPKS